MTRPVVLVSKCLGFDRCRYNGVTIPCPFVESLKPHVEFITVCPEVAIGLGVPRDPIRIVRLRGKDRLIQPSTTRDVTVPMEKFSREFLDRLPLIDGALLKSRSPSCGIKDVKIFPHLARVGSIGTGAGFFGRAVRARFPELPVEDEGRILNFRIREHFLIALFAWARFDDARAAQTMSALVDFHSRHKLLLMAYHQSSLRLLGRIVANHERMPAREVFARYRVVLETALSKPPRSSSNVNVIMHALGYFSKQVTPRERRYLLDMLDHYREGKLPLSAIVGVVNAWIVRFNEAYLASQAYFSPYPGDLVVISDSGKGRDLDR